MGSFLRGFVQGAATSGSRQIQEAEEEKRNQELLQKKMMYELAVDDYKAKAADRRKIAETTRLVTQALGPDAPPEITAQIIAAAQLQGADVTQLIYRGQKMIQNQKAPVTATSESPTSPLPGMSPTSGAPAMPPGFQPQGNIDLNNRPVVPNPEGGPNGYSTVRSKSFNFDGKETLIPTVSDDGRLLTDDEAIDQYKKTGKHLGQFNSVDEANAYAVQLHNQQAQQYKQQAPWLEIKGDNGNLFAPAIDPAKNKNMLDPLVNRRKELSENGASNSLLAETDDAIAAINTLGDPGDVGMYTGKALAYINQKAEKEGVTSVSGKQRETLIATAKVGLERAMATGRPDLANEFSSDIAALSSTGANFDILSTRISGRLGQLPSATVSERTAQGNLAVSQQELGLKTRQAGAAPLIQGAQDASTAGNFGASYDMNQQAANYITGKGDLPDAQGTQQKLKGIHKPEDTVRLMRHIESVLDPTAQQSDGINISIGGKPRETKPGIGDAKNAIAQWARYRIDKGYATGDELIEGGRLAGFAKSAFPVDWADTKPESRNGVPPPPGTAKKPTANIDNHAIIESVLSDADMKRNAPDAYNWIEQQVLKNSTDKNIKAEVEAAKAKASGGMPPKSAPAKSAPKGNDKTSQVEKPYDIDRVTASAPARIRQDRIDQTAEVVQRDNQRIEQEKAAGAPKRDSVAEYHQKIEDLSDDEARVYMKANPFKGDREDLIKYAALASRIVPEKKAEKAPAPIKSYIKDLNENSLKITEIAHSKVKLADIPDDSMSTVVAKKKLKMLAQMDKERFELLIEYIDDPTLKQFFTRTYKEAQKAIA